MATSTKKPGTAIVPWEQEMAAFAAKSAGAEKSGFTGLQKLGVKGGVLTVDDVPVPGNELSVITLCAVHHNTYYEGAYNPNVKTIPVCYSFGDHTLEDPEAALAPHEASTQPQGDENGLCAGCELNKMGTADTGKGKACKNSRNIALVTSDAAESPEAMAGAEVRVLSVPVMSVKFWAAHVKRMNDDLKRPYWGVVTRIKVVPDPKSQFLVKFEFEANVDFNGPLYEAFKTKIEGIWPELTAPYQEPTQEEAPPPRRTVPVKKVIPVKTAPVAAKKTTLPPAKTAGPAKKTAKY